MPCPLGARAAAYASALVLPLPLLFPAHNADACGAVDSITDADAMRAATFCLLNAERTSRGLRPLKLNIRLRSAAIGHSTDMVTRRYFAHDSPSGASPGERVAKKGYLSRRGLWLVGENLGWGVGSLGTPRAMVQAWMASPGHAENVLDRRYRDLGIGIAFGAPDGSGAPDAVTYTTDFGRRR